MAIQFSSIQLLLLKSTKRWFGFVVHFWSLFFRTFHVPFLDIKKNILASVDDGFSTKLHHEHIGFFRRTSSLKILYKVLRVRLLWVVRLTFRRRRKMTLAAIWIANMVIRFTFLVILPLCTDLPNGVYPHIVVQLSFISQLLAHLCSAKLVKKKQYF